MTEGSSAATPQIKRIGELFVESGFLSEPDLLRGLEYSKKTGMPLGRVLVMLRLASDIDLRAVLQVQSLMKFENMPGSLAVRALVFMKEKNVHIEWAVKQVGWQSDKFKQQLPQKLRDLKDVISDLEDRLGYDHPRLAEAMLRLSDFYEEESMWAHAEAQCEQAIVILERSYGKNDLRVCNAHWKLANMLFQQDRYEESQTHYQVVLEIKQNLLGTDHPETAEILKDLGEVCDIQKRYSEAERFYTQALAIKERYQEIDEPELIDLLKRLAYVCSRRGRSPDQVLVGQLLVEAGIISEDAIPDALIYGKQHNVPLARALVQLKHLSEDALKPALQAQLLMRSNLLPAALAYRILKLCTKHGISIDAAMQRVSWKLQTSRSYNLSELMKISDELVEAENRLPPDHPDIAALCLRLADLFDTYERYADAEPVYKRALAIIEQHGEGSSELVDTLDRLGWVSLKQGKFEQADSLYRKALQVRTELLGPEHIDLASSYMHLGHLDVVQGNHREAIAHLEAALPIVEKAYGPKHAQVGNILEQLAVCFYESKDYGRAEPLFWQAFIVMKEYMDLTSFELVSLMSKLADLYNKTGKIAQADSVLMMFKDAKPISL